MLLLYNSQLSKKCKVCATIKLTQQFNKSCKPRGDGYSSYCKACDSARRIAYKLKISIDEYFRYLNQRPKLCEICKARDRKLCLDHNHETGKIRGWLCYGCNINLEYDYKFEHHTMYVYTRRYLEKYDTV